MSAQGAGRTRCPPPIPRFSPSSLLVLHLGELQSQGRLEAGGRWSAAPGQRSPGVCQEATGPDISTHAPCFQPRCSAPVPSWNRLSSAVTVGASLRWRLSSKARV